MSSTVIAWLFVAGVLAHHVEEALLLPSWSHRRFSRTRCVPARAFQLAVTTYSVIIVGAAAAATYGGAMSYGAYLMAGFALTMVLNVVFPHLGATIWLRTYAPGTATALLLNLPLGIWLIRNFITTGFIDVHEFRLVGPVIVLVSALSIPVLLGLSRKLIIGSSSVFQLR